MPLEFHFPATQAALSISAYKTVRIKNDGRPHDLPESIGELNYFQWGTQRLSFLEQKNQALWFSFKSNNANAPFALKILAGGINALTGENETEADYTTLRNNDANGKGQNYLLVPGQRWLDGFKTKDGIVRQFVAVKLGDNRSVEEKLEGTQRGGISFIVIPTKQNVYDKKMELLREAEQVKEAELKAEIERIEKIIAEKEALLQDTSLDQTTIDSYIHEINALKFSLPAAYPLYEAINYSQSRGLFSSLRKIIKSLPKIGLAAGGMIQQDIVASNVSLTDFDTAEMKYMDFDLIDLHTFNQINRRPQPPRPLTHDEYTNAGRYWYTLLSERSTVRVDETSRLAQLEQNGRISAFPSETPAVSVPASQNISLREHGFFNGLRRRWQQAFTANNASVANPTSPSFHS